MQNKNKKKFLIGVLVLLIAGALYYFGIYKTTEESISAYNLEIESVSAQIDEENAKNIQYENMSIEVEEGKASGSMVYDYDQAEAELNYLSQVVSQAITYNLSFDEPFTEDGVYVRRKVNISFTASNYKLAREIINGIIACPYRTIFNDVTFTPRSKNGATLIDMSLSGNCEVEVVADIAFIENIKGVENTKGVNDLRPVDTEVE